MYKNLGRCILMADLTGYTNTLPDYNTKIGDIMGKFTCYDPNADTPSVIDYALADRELFNEI